MSVVTRVCHLKLIDVIGETDTELSNFPQLARKIERDEKSREYDKKRQCHHYSHTATACKPYNTTISLQASFRNTGSEDLSAIIETEDIVETKHCWGQSEFAGRGIPQADIHIVPALVKSQDEDLAELERVLAIVNLQE